MESILKQGAVDPAPCECCFSMKVLLNDALLLDQDQVQDVVVLVCKQISRDGDAAWVSIVGKA